MSRGAADPERAGMPTLVVGGGVAGLTAALDLAHLGRAVLLVESGISLGGRVAGLDKLYPYDHCAFCPLWTEITRCLDHPGITLYLRASLEGLDEEGVWKRARIRRRPLFVDPDRCVFCGRCVGVCPAAAIHPLWKHLSPPVYVIREEACTRCGLCQEICPTHAIDLDQRETEELLTVREVIWATGFQDADLTPLKEFGYGLHPDIMTGMELEAWIAEAGPNRGEIRRRSDGSIPEDIAFVQCVGARDKRMFSHCNSVCCMHALKQMRWILRRSPLIQCTLFYTDRRWVGKDYHRYAAGTVAKGRVALLRGRPGLIRPRPESGRIAVTFEDTQSQTVETREFDLVVLNGGLVQTPIPGEAPGDPVAAHACGFCLEPSDIVDSVVGASRAALESLLRSREEG